MEGRPEGAGHKLRKGRETERRKGINNQTEWLAYKAGAQRMQPSHVNPLPLTLTPFFANSAGVWKAFWKFHLFLSL